MHLLRPPFYLACIIEPLERRSLLTGTAEEGFDFSVPLEVVKQGAAYALAELALLPLLAGVTLELGMQKEWPVQFVAKALCYGHTAGSAVYGGTEGASSALYAMMPTVNPVERFGKWFSGEDESNKSAYFKFLDSPTNRVVFETLKGATVAGVHTWFHYKAGHLLGKGISYGLK